MYRKSSGQARKCSASGQYVRNRALRRSPFATEHLRISGKPFSVIDHALQRPVTDLRISEAEW